MIIIQLGSWVHPNIVKALVVFIAEPCDRHANRCIVVYKIVDVTTDELRARDASGHESWAVCVDGCPYAKASPDSKPSNPRLEEGNEKATKQGIMEGDGRVPVSFACAFGPNNSHRTLEDCDLSLEPSNKNTSLNHQREIGL